MCFKNFVLVRYYLIRAFEQKSSYYIFLAKTGVLLLYYFSILRSKLNGYIALFYSLLEHILFMQLYSNADYVL